MKTKKPHLQIQASQKKILVGNEIVTGIPRCARRPQKLRFENQKAPLTNSSKPKKILVGNEIIIKYQLNIRST
ncbi:MAG: hypothetical protein AAGC45_00740 [Bacteroidota bacterium]